MTTHKRNPDIDQGSPGGATPRSGGSPVEHVNRTHLSKHNRAALARYAVELRRSRHNPSTQGARFDAAGAVLHAPGRNADKRLVRASLPPQSRPSKR